MGWAAAGGCPLSFADAAAIAWRRGCGGVGAEEKWEQGVRGARGRKGLPKKRIFGNKEIVQFKTGKVYKIQKHKNIEVFLHFKNANMSKLSQLNTVFDS